MSESTNLNTAVLHAAYSSRASYYDDWLDAFTKSDKFTTTTFNITQKQSQRALLRSIKDYDLVVLLHSVNADSLVYATEVLPILQSRKGILLSFIGNELSLPGSPLAPKISYLKEANADIIATQLLLETGEYLYSDTGAQVKAIPHALNPNHFYPTIPYTERSIDIGVRSFRYPTTFLGDQDRNRVLDYFSNEQISASLTVDIDTKNRLNRTEWAAFLNNCRATVSNEAGGHWIEKDDHTMLMIKSWLEKNKYQNRVIIQPNDFIRKLVRKLPWQIRQMMINILTRGPISYDSVMGQDIDFEEVFNLFYKDKPFPPVVSGKCISSRHFDAIGTQTCQVLLRGRYNNILKADEHFIALNSDFSNIDLVMEKLQDISYCQDLVRNTFEYVMSEHTYVQRIEEIERIVSDF